MGFSGPGLRVQGWDVAVLFVKERQAPGLEPSIRAFLISGGSL